MKHRNLLEVFYVMYSPLLILLGNVICGLCYLQKIYIVANYFSVLTGYSLIFIPQFIINYKKYGLCKFYLAAVTFLSMSIFISLLYQYNILSDLYYYVRGILAVNVLGCICYFFVKRCKNIKTKKR